MAANGFDDDQTRSFANLVAGTKVSHYTIISKIGAGGMGEVYLAEDAELDRKVALKFLPPHLSQDQDSRARFTREAKAAAKLDHPNIVPVYEVGEFQGRPFFAMAHIEGQSLREVIKQGKLSVSDTVGLTMQVCEGLHEAHCAGVVHRDVKPGNIIIDNKGKPRLLDFGLATVTGEEKLTKTGSTLGTVGYMSPEQVGGKKVDHRSDLFSVGVILYEMLTGRRPFEGDNDAAVVKAITDATPEPVARFKSGTTGELQQIIDKALAKDPTLRYQHADGMLADLRRLQAGVSHTDRNRYSPWIIAALFAVISGLVLITKPWMHRTDSDEVDRIMLAVLPFENIADAEDDYFTDGITEEITSRLALIRKFGVISRTSTIGYKNSRKSIQEIANELGVEYILEGTVRFDQSTTPPRVRITPQLIRAADDIHIWTERIDQPLEDIFEVQSEVAEKIATALDVTLVQAEREAVEDIPTQNMEAYQLWLQAGYHGRQPGYPRERAEMAQRLLERAVQLDTLFVRALADVSRLHAAFYHFGWDRSAERLAQAETAAARARQIEPDGLHVRFALGTLYYFCHRDYDRALEEFRWILDRFPSHRETKMKVAYILRRQGKLSEAVKLLLESQKLDPRSSNGAWEIANTFYNLREFDLAVEYAIKAINLGPDNVQAYEFAAKIHRIGFADIESARRLLEMCPIKRPQAWVLQFLCERQFDSALAYSDSLASGIIDNQSDVSTRSLNKAFVLRQMSRDALAYEQFDSARVVLERHYAETPEDYRIIGALAQAYAGLGRVQDALAFAERAVTMCPVEKDLFAGSSMKRSQLLVHVMTGDMNEALNILDYMLSIPSGITLTWLKLDPRYDPLRDHPHFQALLEKYDTSN